LNDVSGMIFACGATKMDDAKFREAGLERRESESWDPIRGS